MLFVEGASGRHTRNEYLQRWFKAVPTAIAGYNRLVLERRFLFVVGLDFGSGIPPTARTEALSCKVDTVGGSFGDGLCQFFE
ncbi:hypothetical protein ACFQJ7_01695 [Halovenus rubra]|uniref:Uncharacterized protein n=2 Tax=Halovenus rubra TaxID=869890 RepID=A0ACC7E668_9EURY|nr:hypothetical protein [Halovenus rubra]